MLTLKLNDRYMGVHYTVLLFFKKNKLYPSSGKLYTKSTSTWHFSGITGKK